MNITITIELEDGKKVSLSEKEARKLWDKLNDFYGPRPSWSYKPPVLQDEWNFIPQWTYPSTISYTGPASSNVLYLHQGKNNV